jgi:predicted ATPase/DNA-binding SARP family transcriptional activator
LLWPDWPEQDARHNLSQALFKLRLALGDHNARPPYLLIARDAIQFNRESDYLLDLDQFNAYFSAWEKVRGLESVDASNLLNQLEEMVRLYRGEFLQHFYLKDSAEFEEWILVQREALHQRAMNALTSLANEYELRGDFQAAHSYALRQLEVDPWREEAHCQIMRLLASDGQRSSALAQFESCRKVLAEELGVEPSPKTRDLYEQIRSGTFKPKAEPPAPVSSPPIHNLPRPLTPFIGREQELAELAGLIVDPECRCITLVGPGGIGKTRLALKAAKQHAYEFTQGTAFFPLASIGSIEAVIPAIANGIGFAFYGPIDPKIQLLNHLREKQMLLVVDNVEHLLAEVNQQGTIADLLIEILQAASQVKLLVTSREAMNLQGEWPFEVRGLAFPEREQTDRLDEYSAVALFLQRARRARPGFEINAENKTGVVHLCRLVEGLPLAIELAAAWVRVLSPMEIAKEIETSLDFLNAQMRDLPERHRSMLAVFDHSWQMLSIEEKQVLSKLSVFRGGFDRQAAEQVAGASLPVLSSLVIRSLLRHAATGRYDLHELIRQYAASKLAEDPHEQHTVQERHSQYYLGLLEEEGLKLQSHDQKEAVVELTVEMDNIRAAWDCSIADQKFIPLYQVSARLMHLFEVRNWFKEGESTFRKTADALRASLPGYNSEVVHRVALNGILAHCGFFMMRLGKGEEAYATLASSADFLRTAFLRTGAEPLATIYSHYYLGIDCWMLGKFSEAKESLEETMALARTYGERWFEALDSEFLGRLAIEQGEYEQARQYLTDGLAIIRLLGDPSMTAHALSYLGRMMQILGQYHEAERLLREGLELAHEIGYRFTIGLSLDGLGKVAYSQGRHEEARAFFSESASLFQEMGDTHRLSRALNHQGFNSLSLGDAAEAKNAFQTALKMAYEAGFFPSALNALTGFAALYIHQKTRQETLELVLHILQHPASSQETKGLAARLQVELEAKLTKEEIEAAQLLAGSQSLDKLVHQFLASG